MKNKMKAIQILKFSIVVYLLVAAQAVCGAEVSRTIKKNFSVSASTTLQVKNSFGRIHIENWDKQEFGIEIEIIGRSSSESKAQDIVDRIEIDISESNDLISLITDLNNIKTRNKESFEVNYQISMPALNTIKVRNSFGDVFLDDRNGEVDMDLSYGALKAKDFNEESNLKLSYGKGYVEHFSRGEVEVKYSDLDIQSSKELRMDQRFSNVEIEEMGRMDLVSKYGSVELGSVDEIEVEVSFSGFSIEKLSKSLEMEADYVSDFEIGLLKKEFELVDIVGKYGSYDIRIEEGLSADLEASFRYSDLRNYADIDFNYRVKDNNESEYRGKIGGGSSSKRILIRSSYGNCTISD